MHTYYVDLGGSGDCTLSRTRKNACASSFHRCIDINEKSIEDFFMLWRKKM